jgi:hypothetical protein
MTNTSKQTSNIKNGLIGSTVNIAPGYGAIPPLTTSQMFTTGAGTAGGPNSFGGSSAGGTITLNGGSHIYATNTTSLGGGSSGQFLTSGSNGTSWTNSTTIADNILVAKNNPPELEVKGRMVINGKDLEERLDTIEKVLQIPERDVILEKKHPKLKKLYDEYINALGKYRTFEAIKGDE